jgi:membrane-associated phospholipid phosphatase
VSSPRQEIRKVRRCGADRPLAVVAAVAIAVFAALTVLVTTSAPLGLDRRAFEIAADLRAPWLDHAARVITALGLFAVVGPAVLAGAASMIHRREHARAAVLLAGATIAWISVWIVKAAVDRPRPPAPLVHASGPSFPSGHAANSVGWLALAIALTAVIPTRGVRIAALAAGMLLALLIGLSRIYLRAHYASDVIAGEALAASIYAVAAIGSVAYARHKRPRLSARGST